MPPPGALCFASLVNFSFIGLQGQSIFPPGVSSDSLSGTTFFLWRLRVVSASLLPQCFHPSGCSDVVDMSHWVVLHAPLCNEFSHFLCLCGRRTLAMSVLAFCSGLLVGLDSCFWRLAGLDLSGLFLFQGLVTSTLLVHFSFLPGMSLGFTFLLAPHFVPLCSASFRAVPFMKTFLLALASAQGFSELPLFLCGSSLRGLVLSDFFFRPQSFLAPSDRR